MNLRSTVLRSLRIVHFALLTATILYIILILWRKPTVRRLDPIVVGSVYFVCGVIVCVAVFYRSTVVNKSAEQLNLNSADGALLQRWRSGALISLVCAESVVLFGFMLKVLGASWDASGGLFVVGILLLLVWTPRLETLPE